LPIRAMLTKELGDIDIFTSLANLPLVAERKEGVALRATVPIAIFFRNSRLFCILI